MRDADMKHKWYEEICAWARGERIEYRHARDADDRWIAWTTSPTPPFDNDKYEFRIAPKTRRVTLESGEVVEWPEPMREAPEKGAYYWLPLIVGGAECYCWTDAEIDHRNLNTGRFHATREAAEQHAEALRKINGVGDETP